MNTITDVGTWASSWIWGVPLIVTSVVVHVLGLVMIRSGFARFFTRRPPSRGEHLMRFAAATGTAVLLITILHVLQAVVWAFAYVALDALPSPRIAMLYSLNAMTAYGHITDFLAPHWQLLGALQALNGLILFGLSTAFLYGMIEFGSPARQR
ncbi:hypothetical protein [Roseomonas fluvialis]|uniref:Potassium channel domain-containing protein n=1 Tax=Roseomonas fluvialis TaxID=1750527 RepID=A0ABM7XXJ8_9PROT|nr:hypothetical protein [Roseomonas fluvialis]BDG70175.1 hypothetical protein Rmf_01040 [Roseomonas fluvialis]